MARYGVFVRTLDSKTYVVNVRDNAHVSTLRLEIAKKLQTPVQYLRLLYNGKHLHDDALLEKYRLVHGSTVDVTMRLVGGFFPVITTNPDLVTVGVAKSFWDKVKDVAENVYKKTKDGLQKAQDTRDRIILSIRYGQVMGKISFMFTTFMKTMFIFFSIVILVRMIIGFFSKPLEFIMLGVACMFLSIAYVIYFLLSIPNFTIFIPFGVWFLLFDIVPFIVYVIIMGALFLIITLFCFLLWFVNLCTGGALNSLVLCQNSTAAWYKTPNYHLGNRYERGFFCSRECFPGYYPDDTGMFCVKNASILTPSYCPQAEAMRLFIGKRNDINYVYKDYQTIGNLKYLAKSPEQREKLIKDHFMKKMNFLDKCNKSMKRFDHMPLNICSSLDTMTDVDPVTVKKLRQVCSQAFCNSKTNYGFCPQLEGAGGGDDSDFWKKAIHMTIMVMVFVFVLTFTLGYIAGIPMTA